MKSVQHPGAQPFFWTRREVGARTLWLWAALSAWLLAAATLLAGAPRPAAAFLSAAALAIAVGFFRLLRDGFAGLSVYFSLLATWTALTAVPLPCGLVRTLAPVAGEIWASALTPLGEPSLATCALSVAPFATVQSAMNLASYALVAATATAVARALGLGAVLLSVLGVASFVAIVTLVHAVLGTEHLFGVSSLPAKSATGPASVIVNPNNLAGFMNLGVFSALALLGSRRPPAPRPLVVVAGMLAVATTISSGSRGGVASLAFGLVAFGLLLAWRRLSGKGRAVTSQAPFVLIVVLAGVALAILGASPALERDLFGDDVSKLGQIERVAKSLDRVDWSGAGRGAFDSLSARIMGERGNFTHEYVENFALSWLFEWGPWVGGAALLGLAYLLSPTRLRVRGHPPAACAWLGLVVLLLQNLADLGLELPALSGALAVIAGGLEGSRNARRRSDQGQSAPRPHAAVPLRLVSALLAVTLVWTLATGPTLAVLRERARSSSERALAEGAGPVEREQAWRDVRLGLTRYPAEPYFALAGGWLALAAGQDATPWASEALRRAPRLARAHLLAAQVLVRRGAPEQALLHVARAVAAEGALSPELAAWIADWPLAVRRLEAAAPAGAVGARFLLQLSAALGTRADPSARQALLEAAMRRAPTDLRVLAAEGWALLSDLRQGSAPCPRATDGARCPLRADARARLLTVAAATRSTPTCEGLRLEAALMAQEGRGADALGLLEACPSCAAPAACAKDRVIVALDFGDEAQRRQALGAFRAGTCDSVSRCADAESWLATVFLGRSRPEEALLFAWKAAELDPSGARYLAAARMARAAGRVDRVEVALSRARRWGDGDPELDQWLAERRSAGLESMK